MGIFDKILGKEEKEEKKPAKTEKKTEVKKEKPADIVSEKKEVAKKEEPKKSKKKPEVKKETKARKVSKKDENIAHKVLFENILSEKSTMMAAENKYAFKVDKKSGKNQIKEAVEGYYGVQVTGVNTIKIHPKKRIHGRTIGWKKGYKKAIVTLREGDTITAVEGV
ncbi:MAG: 50S ribosomal protein L23 [Candidatus Moranbacteria bacterium]|nr:50S ribosomal protein L23 [Candidatus Moranbacteria bacterium]